MLTDIVADSLTRIRNAQMAMLSYVEISFSTFLEEIMEVLKESGYISDYEVIGEVKKIIRINLKYHNGKSVISQIKRCSKPGKREYVQIKNLPKYFNGLGIYILSTPKGVMTDHKARHLNVGGELICCVF
uniref:30S ribosomal protein S8 n=1 Tax=Rickettsiales endosymbiont of Stachyamoeba lipophora TaxID=2486578 RepID=UPI0026BBFC78